MFGLAVYALIQNVLPSFCQVFINQPQELPMQSIFRRRSDTRYVTFFIILLSSLLLASCAGSGGKIQHSGYLNDYSKLQPFDGGSRWISSKTDFSKYTKFILEPVTFYVGKSLDQQNVKANPENINKITAYFHEALTREFSKNLTIVDKAGPDVGRIRTAITSMAVGTKDLKAYQYLPVMLVATGAAEVAGLRDHVAVISMEGELLDSLTGQRLAAVVKSRSKETTIKEVGSLTEQDVKSMLDYWASESRIIFVKNIK